MALNSNSGQYNQNQRRIGSILRTNESNNMRSALNNNPNINNNNNNNINLILNSNSNDRALGSLSTNNRNINVNRNTRINNQTSNINNNNSLVYQDYDLFPFINDGVNCDIGMFKFLLLY